MPVRNGAVVWLVLAALVAWLLVTGASLGLASSTETRYAEIAREMRASGDWVVPTFNGAPHLEKPPFAYWAIAASYAVFGVNDVAPRVPSLLAWLGVVWLIGRAARRPRLTAPAAGSDPAPVNADRDAAAFGRGAALLCALTPALLFQGFVVSTDAWLVLATTAAGVAMLESDRAAGRPALRWTLLLHAGLGLGMLVKGPIAIALVLGAGLATALWRRDAKHLRPFVHPLGLAVLLAVSLPWYLVANARLPGLLDLYVGKRLFGGLASSAEFHGGGVHVIWGPVLLGTLPWIGALPGALRALARGGGLSKGPAGILLPLALAAPVLFTFSKSRLPSYGSPALPFVALLVALGAAGGATVRRGLLAGSVALAVAVTANAVFFATSVETTLAVEVALAAVALLAILSCAWPRRAEAAPDAGFSRAALCVGCWLLSVGIAIPATPRYLDAERNLWRAVERVRAPGDDLGVLVRSHDDWGLLPFYAAQDVRFFGYESFLAVKPPEESTPENFLRADRVGAWLASSERRWLMIRKDQPRADLGVPVWLLVEDEKYAVVTNAPLAPR